VTSPNFLCITTVVSPRSSLWNCSPRSGRCSRIRRGSDPHGGAPLARAVRYRGGSEVTIWSPSSASRTMPPWDSGTWSARNASLRRRHMARSLRSIAINAPLSRTSLPVLLSWMEQRYRFLCERIDGANGVRLELVARPARQANVIEGRQSTARCRRDVVIRQRDAAHRFAREAVAARPSIRGIDLRAQRLRDPARHDLGNQLSDG